jgi:hypothetical protein
MQHPPGYSAAKHVFISKQISFNYLRIAVIKSTPAPKLSLRERASGNCGPGLPGRRPDSGASEQQVSSDFTLPFPRTGDRLQFLADSPALRIMWNIHKFKRTGLKIDKIAFSDHFFRLLATRISPLI